MPPFASPDDVIRSIFALVAEERYQEVAALVDPADLLRFREEAVRRQRESAVPLEPAEVLEPPPPDSLSVYDGRLAELAAGILGWQYAGVQEPEHLEALEPAELLARWLQAQDPRYTVPRLMRLAGAPASATDDAGLTARRTVLGSVREGDDLAHVVYRMEHQGNSTLELLSCRLRDGAWRMLVPASFPGAGNWYVSLAPPARGDEG